VTLHVFVDAPRMSRKQIALGVRPAGVSESATLRRSSLDSRAALPSSGMDLARRDACASKR
jgi:hypothetical protein